MAAEVSNIRRVDEIRYQGVCKFCKSEFAPDTVETVAVREFATWDDPKTANYTLHRYVMLKDYQSLRDELLATKDNAETLSKLHKELISEYEEVMDELEQLRKERAPQEPAPDSGG